MGKYLQNSSCFCSKSLGRVQVTKAIHTAVRHVHLRQYHIRYSSSHTIGQVLSALDAQSTRNVFGVYTSSDPHGHGPWQPRSPLTCRQAGRNAVYRLRCGVSPPAELQRVYRYIIDAG